MNIGLSTCGKVINEKLFSDYKNSGIVYMEVSMGTSHKALIISF